MTILQYITKINTLYKTGNAREHSYRGDLQNLLMYLLTDVLVTNEPARVDCGAPDYVLTRKDVPVGYIEAKDIGVDLGSKTLKERNPKWINDDYVKFIRFSSHLIEKNGEGILAFINPHGYLDNPTFRGMRWHLMKTFDKIYTIDLHGNSKKKETAPDGSIDQNVFDIMQGVSINIFVKKKND